MSSVVEKIQEESQQLPEFLALQVYDFICFIKARYENKSNTKVSPTPDWEEFFKCHSHTIKNAVPLSRDEIYAERLR